MTTLTQVEIDGFRGLRSLNLEGLGRVNILVGQNNCGKTSVLEALSILCQPQNPNEWLSMVNRRDFGRLNETILQSLRWCFTQAFVTDYEELIEASCVFKCNGSELQKLAIKYSEFIGKPSPAEIKRSMRFSLAGRNNDALSMKGAELTYFPLWIDSSRNDEKIKSLVAWESLPSFLHKYSQANSKSITITPYSYQLNRLQLRAQSKQLFSNDIVELLQDFDADIDGIQIASFSGERAAIYIKHKQLGIAPLSVFGDATRRAVLLTSTLLSLKDGGVLLIDEVEVGIHVSALANVFKWLVNAARKLNVQVFVTTHSLEALDAITFSDDDSAEEDIVVFRLKQTEEKTESKRLSGDLLHRLRFERGLDVR
jgi:AAA15 family ATPase/GTPase